MEVKSRQQGELLPALHCLFLLLFSLKNKERKRKTTKAHRNKFFCLSKAERDRKQEGEETVLFELSSMKMCNL